MLLTRPCRLPRFKCIIKSRSTRLFFHYLPIVLCDVPPLRTDGEHSSGICQEWYMIRIYLWTDRGGYGSFSHKGHLCCGHSTGSIHTDISLSQKSPVPHNARSSAQCRLFLGLLFQLRGNCINPYDREKYTGNNEYCFLLKVHLEHATLP